MDQIAALDTAVINANGVAIGFVVQPAIRVTAKRRRLSPRIGRMVWGATGRCGLGSVGKRQVWDTD